MSLPTHVLVLAAGQGKRMHSALPKVLHPVLYRPMLHYVLDLAGSLPHASCTVIVGHGEAQVREACALYPDLQFARQSEPRGTGHAVRAAEGLLGKQSGQVLILSGDVILLRKESLTRLLEVKQNTQAAGVLLTADLANPHGYGRIVRSKGESVACIREELDCSPEERALSEVNCGIYCFDNEALFAALAQLTDKNRQKEFYLTDVVELLNRQGKSVRAVKLGDPTEMTGINDRLGLAEVETLWRQRVNRQWMQAGVTLRNPDTITIDPRCVLEPDCVIEGGCVLIQSTVCRGAVIKQGSYLESSYVGPGSSVGPYAHLRPGTRLEQDVKIGNFVETKTATFGPGAKASHLSYIGDAQVGAGVNLGCGFITCNFDGGPQKHRTIIEDGVFVGSDSQAVAPITLGKGSYIASGTTLTRDVPPGALAISRGKQVNKEGFVERLKARKGAVLPKK